MMKRNRNALKITLLLGVWFNVILCAMQLEKTTSRVSSCKNPPLCYLSDPYKTELNGITLLSHSTSPNFQTTRQQSNLQRSYYNGFGGSSASPTYYHAFDPISVLASLAFLAFLLQSFASLFERSRSILPTIVSGRESAMDLKIPEISRHVSHALNEYESLNQDLNASK